MQNKIFDKSKALLTLAGQVRLNSRPMD